MKFVTIHILICIMLMLLPIYTHGYGNSTTETPTGKDYLHQLYSDHLTDYDVRIRPRYNQSEALNIVVLFTSSGLIEFDTALQIFTFNTFFVFQWHDEFLKWHPLNYGGIKRMKLPKSQIWSPAVNIEISTGGSHFIGHTTDRAVVLSSGMVTWTPRGSISVLCNVRIKYYPFDVQKCLFTLSVPGEDIFEVRLEANYKDVITDWFMENSKWETLEIIGYGEEYYNFTYLTYEWTLKRRPSFILYTIVLPLLLLSIMNIGVILVPIASGDKGSMATTLFLSYGVFVSSISENIPNNSTDISLFVVYICLLLIFSGATVFYTIVQSKVYFKIGQTQVQFHSPRFLIGGCKRNKTNQATEDTVTDKHERPTDDKTGEAQRGDVGVTWEQLLSTIDFFLFCVFLAIDTISTVVFFMYMSK